MSSTPLPPELAPCVKCNHTGKRRGEFRAAGGFFSAMFDVATERFVYGSCARCGHTEFYNKRLGGGSKVLDFLGS
jgi:uncharacterized protein